MAYSSIIMRRSRHQRLLRRISILAILALLWSQFVMASHPAASMVQTAMAATTTSSAMAHQGCHDQKPADQDGVCAAHCSQGDQSNEMARIPPIPPFCNTVPTLLPLPSVLQAGSQALSEAPTHVAWHRPTLHPASLLLI